MTDSISRAFNGVGIDQKTTNGYINLNQMARATGKRIDNWLRLQETQDLIQEFEEQQNLHSSDLRNVEPALITSQARFDRGGGTWAHPDIAIQFAQWCSPVFALQVSRWVREWMTTGRNPLADIDRVGLRDSLKDESRVRMTDQVKSYLEAIKRYDDKNYRGKFFAKVHDAINIAITTETSQIMQKRISQLLGRKINQKELIRDYFPSSDLQRYISVCETVANLLLRGEIEHPMIAVERAVELVLPAGYIAQPINFVEHIKLVRARVAEQLIDSRRDDLYRRLADR